VSETDLSALYRNRFVVDQQETKRKIWETLCRGFFQEIVGDHKTVVDIACGYGEFINSISGDQKYGIDLNPDSKSYLDKDVQFFCVPANNIPMEANSVNVAFASNFLEHLRTKEECNEVLKEVRRILKPGGKFVILGPNIRYLADKYWDFYDHHLALSHLSLEEGLTLAEYKIERVIPRFLPYTAVKTRLPTHPALVGLYLRVPFVWRILGRQFLVVAVK
jgi:ubiquinone/menaquinone biosynthesis C-methylase UbiE